MASIYKIFPCFLYADLFEQCVLNSKTSFCLSNLTNPFYMILCISSFSLGTLTKACNSLNLYTAADRKREKSRVIVRPTSYPREVLIDTCGIFGFPGEFSEPTSPQGLENGSTIKSRSPFCPPDLR